MIGALFPSGVRTFTVRGQRIVLDSDLAEAYGVATKRLNEQIRRHARRFPQDFVFLLSSEEWKSVKAQLNRRGHRRSYLPYAFTEHGALMAAGVLTSRRAIEASIYIIRTFFVMQR